MEEYFNKKHERQLESVSDYLSASNIALEIISKMPQPLNQVCGPITSGGKSSIKENLETFEKTIYKLRDQGEIIFNQLPFEKTLEKIWRNDNRKLREKNLVLLKDFYFPIFKSGFVKSLYFIHGWKESFGASWEHEEASYLGLRTKYLPRDFLDQ